MIKELCKDTAILSTRCEKATAADADLAQDLVDTLQTLDDAACLAANQIGVTKAVVVWMSDDGAYHVMFNPRIMMGLRAGKATETCLTLDEVSFDELVDGQLVPRKRDYVGWEAQMIQHMVDHCMGKLV